MTRRKSHKKLGLAVLGLTAILVVSIILLVPLNLPQNSVWSVSNINLEERGVNGGDGVLKGGDWRIIGTTDISNIQFLTLNQTTMKNFPGQFPPDVAVMGSVTFGILQNQAPYWHIPLTKIEDIAVYHKTYGSYKTGQDSGHSIDPLTVTLWRTDLANKELVIPFSVGILKTGGGKLGSLVTDYHGAILLHSAQGDYYQFSVSFKSIATGQMSSVINWYNPQDPNQKVKMTLLFTVGGSEFDWSQDYIVVTEQNGGQVFQNNVFPYSSLSEIEKQLNPAFSVATNFESYWLGGGSWKANGYWLEYSMFGSTRFGPANQYPAANPSLVRLADGSMSPLFQVMPVPGLYPQAVGVDSEGYKYNTQDIDPDAPCFPGWYTPSPINTEGITGNNVPSDWQNYRLPVGANVINDKNNLRPTGLSVVNFLSTQTIAGVTKTAVPKQNYNLWGQTAIASYAGSAASNGDSSLKVSIPTAARSWAFQMDVSTDLVDTVVIQQNYIHVVIDSFSVDRDTISVGDSAIATIALRNTSPFSGTASQGFTVPTELQGSCSVSGGDGSLYFQANSSQTVTLHIANTGNLADDKQGTFTYHVINNNGETTDSKTVTLTFKAGLGVPDTMLTVNTLLSGTNEAVNGLKVTVAYGATGTLSQTLDTNGGVVRFDLAKETGACTVTITDPSGRYADQKDFFNLVQGENSKTYYFSNRTTNNGWLSWQLIMIIAIIAMVFLGIGGIAYIVKRRRH